MPLIKIQTSVSAPAKSDVETMLKGLSAKLAKHTGKPDIIRRDVTCNVSTL